MIGASQEVEQAAPSRLELAIRRLARMRAHPFILSIVLAIAITATAGAISWRLSRAYYQTALYHYDSAAYRAQAVGVYETYEAQGRRSAFAAALREKDALDIDIRALAMPRALLSRYGHLVVLLPLMALFFTLLLYYVRKHTASWFLALACAGFLFTFSFVYDVHWGIADYWKDNLATWLFGGAALAWLLARNLTHWRWSLLCSTLLGLLVVQRSVAAVYAAILFFPLVLWALRYQIKTYGLKTASVRALALAAPALVLAAALVMLQWKSLYTYYFVGGYAYANPLAIASYLLRGIAIGQGIQGDPFGAMPYGPGNGSIVLLVYIVCALAITSWKEQRGDVAAATWLVCGLPLFVTLTNAYYHGFFVIWMALLLVLLAALLPRALTPAGARTFALALMLVCAITAGLQFSRSSDQARDLAASSAPYRKTMEALAKLVAAEPAAHTYAMFFSEIGAPFQNLVYFDMHARVRPPAVLITFHDTYFKARFPGQTPEQIVAAAMRPLEQTVGSLAVGYCDPSGMYQPPQNPLAVAAIQGLNRYVLESPFWRVTNQLNSPFGCLYVYRFAGQRLTGVEKWRDMSFSNAASAGTGSREIPLTAGIAPQVRLYEYSGRYAPAYVNGVYYQWLPSGAPGLRLALFSDKARVVKFQAMAQAGPSRSDAERTLVISDAEGSQELRINRQANLRADIRLAAGLNQIEMHVVEPANVSRADKPDKRELLLLLVSPQFVEAAP